MRFTATAIAALFAIGAGSAQAGTLTDATKKIQGEIEINLDKTFDINGTGGLDLQNVEVSGFGDITVDVPATVDNALEFSQGNWGDVTAKKNFTSFGVQDVEVAATAIANVVSIEVPGSLALEGVQVNDGAVTAIANVNAFGAETVDVTATAIGNAVSATVGGDAVVDLSQSNHGNIFAEANVFATGVGEVNTAATAIANVASLELDGNFIGSIDQVNKGNVTALNNDTINARFDPATATAIANAISITQAATR